MLGDEFEETGDKTRPPETTDRLSEDASKDLEGKGTSVCPAAKRVTDDVFGAGKVDTAKGTIDFDPPGKEATLGGPQPARDTLAAPGDTGRPAGDRLAGPADGRLDATQMRLELMQTAMKMMMDMFSKAWFGFGKDEGGGQNPFMQMIQTIMQRAMGGNAPKDSGRRR